MPFVRQSNLLLPGGLFLLFLLYFVFGGGWQEPAKLVLRGRASGGSPIITVRWDSGAGFNDYEQRLFQPEIQPQNGKVNITVGAAGRKHPAAQGHDVICAAVLIDGKEINLHDIAKPPLLNKEELHFNKGDTVSFVVPAQSHIGLRFRTDAASGVAFAEVNGRRTEHDLYMANVEAKFKQLDYWLLQPDRSFTLTADLPRYPVRTLEILNGRISRQVRLRSVELLGKGKVIDLLHGQPVQLGNLRFEHPLDGMKSYVHPLQFVQQILFALLSAWLLTALFRQAGAFGSLRSVFLGEQRQWFWLMLAASLAVFGTWLAAFWPGVMSVDSMKIWRAALRPDVYLNDHPLLNVIFYKYLRHIWGNSAVVPIVQIFLISVLIAWFGFWIYRQGVSLTAVLLWLLFVLCSVPVSVYNTALWKDIPFALLVVFWACFLVKLRQEKQQSRVLWTGQRISALLLLGLAVGLVRHNGLLYFGILPALLLLLSLVPLKKALPVLTVLLLAAGIGFMTLRNTDNTAEVGFFTRTMQWYVSTVKLENTIRDAKRTAHDYLHVLDIEAPQADKFHYYLQDRHAWWFLLHSGWWDVYPYQKDGVPFPKLRQKALKIYEQSYQKSWILLMWNPILLLILLPLLTLCCRWLPNTAVLGAMLLSGALPLVYLQIFNWRYYYFLYFGLLFLPAFISLDLSLRKKCVSPL